jgi:hypothetical protein
MFMPRSRWSWTAVVSSMLILLPGVPSHDASLVQRGALIPDSTFHLPDSVRALLSQVTRIVVAPDSSLYLADRRIPAILHLEPSGEFRRVVGRAGGGPGEFSQVLLIGLYRDSLWAMDPAQVRVTLFPLRGDGARTLGYGPYAPRSNQPGVYARRGLPASILPDGSLLLQEQPTDAARQGLGQLLRVDRSMRVIDTVAPLPHAHSTMYFTHKDGVALAQQPFNDDLIYAVSGDGSLVVLVSRPVALNEDQGEFTVVGLENGVREVFRRTIQYQPRRLPVRVIDSAVTALYGNLEEMQTRSPITADSLRLHIYRPAFYPAVSAVRVARDGSTWIRITFADGPAKADEWMQLSPRGLPVRRVRTPAGFLLLEADRKSVWGTVNDEMDVPQVNRYSIERSSFN